jgi:uncharacterized protein (TIGR03435 family)
MATAFKVDTNKVGCPPGTPTGNFDLLMAGPDSTQEKLQAEIKRQLGYVGHIETRTTDVLLLTLRQADAPGLQPTHSTETRGLVTISGNSLFNVSIPVLVKSYLQPQFQQIILDRSGLTGRYDISFPPGIGILLPPGIGSGKPQSDAITQALTSLGLSLEPGREPLEVLVVEPDKRE